MQSPMIERNWQKLKSRYRISNLGKLFEKCIATQQFPHHYLERKEITKKQKAAMIRITLTMFCVWML